MNLMVGLTSEIHIRENQDTLQNRKYKFFHHTTLSVNLPNSFSLVDQNRHTVTQVAYIKRSQSVFTILKLKYRTKSKCMDYKNPKIPAVGDSIPS